MNKASGQKILIKFTQPITSKISGNEAAFVISGKEYNYEPRGILIDGDYRIDSLRGYSSMEFDVDLNLGIMTGLEYADGTLMLEAKI